MCIMLWLGHMLLHLHNVCGKPGRSSASGGISTAQIGDHDKSGEEECAAYTMQATTLTSRPTTRTQPRIYTLMRDYYLPVILGNMTYVIVDADASTHRPHRLYGRSHPRDRVHRTLVGLALRFRRYTRAIHSRGCTRL